MQEVLIQDRYRIEEKIGRGTVGEVYRATDVTLDRPVAIKMLDQELNEHPRFVERYVHLARTAASLHHPHIVVIHDIVRAPEERVCVVMEYLDGVPLDKALEETTQWPHPQTADVLTGVARALDYAHGQGIYHLGMKSSDIILEPERPVVTDFCVLQALQSLTDRYSLRGLPPAYMAPEQIDSSRGAQEGPWTDIYVLGIIAYQMLFGMLPFRATTPLAILHAHMEQEVPRPAGCPPEIFDPLRKAMAKSPEERYESAGAFVEALLKGLERFQGVPFDNEARRDRNVEARDGALNLQEAGGPTLHALVERMENRHHLGDLRHSNIIALIDILDAGRDTRKTNTVVPVTSTFFIIGREEDANDIGRLAIEDSRVSRKHCQLIYRSAQIFVKDLRSSNGTFLNGERLEPEVEYPVPHGAELMVGPVKMKVYLWSHLTDKRPGASPGEKHQTEIMSNKQRTLTDEDIGDMRDSLQWGVGRRSSRRDQGESPPRTVGWAPRWDDSSPPGPAPGGREGQDDRRDPRAQHGPSPNKAVTQHELQDIGRPDGDARSAPVEAKTRPATAWDRGREEIDSGWLHADEAGAKTRRADLGAWTPTHEPPSQAGHDRSVVREEINFGWLSEDESETSTKPIGSGTGTPTDGYDRTQYWHEDSRVEQPSVAVAFTPRLQADWEKRVRHWRNFYLIVLGINFIFLCADPVLSAGAFFLFTSPVQWALVAESQRLLHKVTRGEAPSALKGWGTYIVSAIWWARKNGQALQQVGINIMPRLGILKLFMLCALLSPLYPVIVVGMFLDSLKQ